jgi:hypothetical protein
MYEIYPGFPAIALGLSMALGYALVMIGLAVLTFSRREFS